MRPEDDEEGDMKKSLLITRPVKEEESQVTIKPEEEEWDPEGDTGNQLTAIMKAAFPASRLILPLPWRLEKQGDVAQETCLLV